MSDDGNRQEEQALVGGGDDASEPRFVLRVTAGPDAGAMCEVHALQSAPLVIGRAAGGGLLLHDALIADVALHAWVDEKALHVRAVGSGCDARVNGVRFVEVVLEGGELVDFGSAAIHVRRVVRLPTQAAAAEGELAQERAFSRIIGKSFEMQRVLEKAKQVASTQVPVLLQGEVGTGKELLAECIHLAGRQASGPFVVVECTDREEILERRLLGDGDRRAFEEAEGGTLVFADVMELTPRLQGHLVALLDAADPGRARSAGRWPRNVRVIATCRASVEGALRRGLFRHELHSRLAGASLEIPPVRQRHGDIPLLVAHFWRACGGKGEAPKALTMALSRAELPGNVRELRHVVSLQASTVRGSDADSTRGVSLARDEAPSASEPRDCIAHVLAEQLSLPDARKRVVRELERLYVHMALDAHQGNVTRAAAASGLTRRYFHLLLAEVRSEPRASTFEAGDTTIARALENNVSLAEARRHVVRELERRYVHHALQAHRGNVTRAAAASGLTRRYFHLLLAEVRDGGFF